MTRAPLSGLLLLTLVFAPAASARDQTRTFDLTTASVQDIQDAVDAGALTYDRLAALPPSQRGV